MNEWLSHPYTPRASSPAEVLVLVVTFMVSAAVARCRNEGADVSKDAEYPSFDFVL